MSRTVTEGLSYTILDVHIFEDRKVRKLCRLCDENAPLVFIGLLCAIGKERYYIEWNEDAVLDLADMLHKDMDYIEKAVDACVEAGLFSKELYDQYHILTSHGIQKQYNFVKSAAGSKIRVSQYSLLDSSEKKAINSEEKGINSEEKGINSQFIPSESDSEGINSQFMPQRKEKKSKVEKRKGNKNNSYSSFPKEKEQEKLFIVSNFFFRGFAHPELEYEKLIAYNNRPGAVKKWDEMDDVEKNSAMTMWREWKELPEQAPRFKQDWLDVWRKVYEEMMKAGAPMEILLHALSDQFHMKVSGDKVWLHIAEPLREYMEHGVSADGTPVMELLKPHLWPYVRERDCQGIYYKTYSP